ncbi:MAG: cation:proton antiporter [Deltaproteobacteria bacterium SG8_13]|nr:MAG: cation:proton antiporter [Deltaproteobacteria bacterium SG8_13]
MNTLIAVLVGVLFGAGIFLMMSRTPVKLIIGLVFLSNAINLLIFDAAGLTRGIPPIIATGAETMAGSSADPLPQALILTAIVISFGVLAFALVLFNRTFKSLTARDLNELKATDT